MLMNNFDSILNCGKLQSIGELTFEIIFAIPYLFVIFNPHISSYLFATPNPYDVLIRFVIADHIRQLNHDICVTDVDATKFIHLNVHPHT
jgi:hypothetical protein